MFERTICGGFVAPGINQSVRAFLAWVAAALLVAALPANAARPLVDTHQLDGYFALFARDVVVPWKRIAVRLDTYSGAPVDFAAYAVDPAEVLVAGANARARAVETSNRTAVVRWKFTPPVGYKFESNDVEIPLANREGFYVIEARRGDAVQQTWLNVTRIGLVAREAPLGVLLYGVDLGSGLPLAGMRVSFLVGTRFDFAKTDANGLLKRPGGARFALAEWGRSRAFVSLSPQAPVPSSVVGVRTDRGVVRAGEVVRIVGFARKRSGTVFRPAAGDARVALLARGRSIASASLKLDASGAFMGELLVPAGTPSGDLSVIATVGGTVGGSSVHVDAGGSEELAITSSCTSPCIGAGDVSVRFVARRGGTALPGVSVAVRVVRSPHVYAATDAIDAERWGTTVVSERSVLTDGDGSATMTLAAPTDGLSSTYGIVATSQSASATTRIVVPNATTAVSIVPDDTRVDIGEPVNFDVRAFDAVDGAPIAARSVRVRLIKGPNAQETVVKLDAQGVGRAIFRSPQLGSNIATAEFLDDPRAIDAAAVAVEPRALGSRAARRSRDVTIELDRPRYKPTDRASATAALSGAVGSVLFALEGTKLGDVRVVPATGGRAAATLALDNANGAVRISATFVRDGTVVESSIPVTIDGPGYPRQTEIATDRTSFAPGSIARFAIKDGESSKSSSIAVRVSDGRPTGGASFDDAPVLLASAGTTVQNPAAEDPNWHAFAAPARSRATDIFSLDRPRAVAPRDTSLAVSAPHAVVWKIDRLDRSSFEVTMPTQPGRYVVSILKMSDDGDVGAASIAIRVQ